MVSTKAKTHPKKIPAKKTAVAPNAYCRHRRIFRFAPLVLVVAWLLPLARVALSARFAPDDMMNLAGYWERGWPKLILAQFAFFSSYYRPMGGLLYMVIFEAFGLAPLPYRVAMLSVLVANALLAYYAAKLLSRSVFVALLTAVLTGYHGATFILFYNTSQIYDILCFFFWFLALIVYLRPRARGAYLNKRQTAVLLGLYICALNSKEMAVTLPLMLLAYEIAHYKLFSSAGAQENLKPALVRASMPIIALGLATVAYVIGKTTGTGAMSNWGGYQPEYSLAFFLDRNAHFATTLLYLPRNMTRGWLLALWIACAYVAFRRNKPYLRWALALVVFGALPISFIPNRGGGCLYIPLFGYALIAAAVAGDLLRLVSREPLLRLIRIPGSFTRVLAAVGLAVCYAMALLEQQRSIVPSYAKSQQPTWSAIQELQKVRPQLRPGAKILFLNDPFVDWDLYFTSQLVLRDRKATFMLERKHALVLTPDAIAKFDHVLRCEGTAIHLVR